MDNTNLIELLKCIDPAALDYQSWCNVGMALHHEGFTASIWDEWSQKDSRYKSGECYRKWASFNGSGTPVTGGTIVNLAMEQGWKPAQKEGVRALDWDDEITKDDDLVIIVKH